MSCRQGSHRRRRWGRGRAGAPSWRARRRWWRLTRGVHRVLWWVLATGLIGGVGIGWALARGGGVVALGVAAVALVLAVPLLGVTSVVLSRPLARLAGVASRLQDGHLASREQLERAGDDELDQVTDALGDLAERVSRQLQDQRALLAAVSHELRSPLGRLRVLAELQREGLAPADVHDQIQAEIDGMDALVGDLLAGARIDFEAVAPEPLSGAEVARRAVEVAQVDVAIDADPAARVRADPTLVTRAVVGLLDNARVYGGGAVALRVRAADDEVVFEVDDDGPGFAAGEEEMAFQPFWRRPGQAGGTGLGLALVRQIAEVHGGVARAVPRAEGGARVQVRLPAVATGSC